MPKRCSTLSDASQKPPASPIEAAPPQEFATGVKSGAYTLGGPLAWYACFLVCMTQAMSMVDRQILAILVPRIKADLQIGDAEMGLLYGTVFALFYAVFSLPLGRLADGWIRTRLLSLCIAGWSMMTALAGFANGFALLAFSRLGVGIGEASVQPAGMSLLSDVFPKAMRGTVTAMIAAAVALGLGAAIWLGGAIADWWDAAYPQGAGAPLGLKGWQAAFVIAALPGFLLAVLLARLPEPERGVADGIKHAPDPAPLRASWETLAAILPISAWINLARRKASPKVWTANIGGLIAIIAIAIALTQWTNGLRDVNPVALRIGSLNLGGNALQWIVVGLGAYIMLCWAQSLKLRDAPAYAVIIKSPSVILLIVLAALQTVINYGVMAWTATYLITEFDLTAARVGLVFGALSGGIGILGPMIAGPISDWARRRSGAGRMMVTLVSLVVSPPLALMTYSAETSLGFYLWFSTFSIALTMWLPPIYATMLDLVLPRMRGAVISFYILTMTIIGLGLGPYAVGLISDLNGGDLGFAIKQVFWLSPVIALLTFIVVRRLSKDEGLMLERARAAGEAV